MKTKTLLLFLFLSGSLFATSKEDQKLIMKNLHQLESGASTAELAEIINSFSETAHTSEATWLMNYYAAYSNLLAAVSKNENAEKAKHIEIALDFISKANQLSPNNSEILALKSWALGMKISLSPMQYGASLGPESMRTLSEAMNLNPDNPRVYFLMGMSSKFTPEEYGGGVQAAIPLFETALEKYKIYKLPSKEMPNWGEKQTKEALADCKK